MKRKIHFAVITLIFAFMCITVILDIYFNNIEMYELSKIWHYAGAIAETPLLVLMLVYMYKYFKLKKGNENK